MVQIHFPLYILLLNSDFSLKSDSNNKLYHFCNIIRTVIFQLATHYVTINHDDMYFKERVSYLKLTIDYMSKLL